MMEYMEKMCRGFTENIEDRGLRGKMINEMSNKFISVNSSDSDLEFIFSGLDKEFEEGEEYFFMFTRNSGFRNFEVYKNVFDEDKNAETTKRVYHCGIGRFDFIFIKKVYNYFCDKEEYDYDIELIKVDSELSGEELVEINQLRKIAEIESSDRVRRIILALNNEIFENEMIDNALKKLDFNNIELSIADEDYEMKLEIDVTNDNIKLRWENNSSYRIWIENNGIYINALENFHSNIFQIIYKNMDIMEDRILEEIEDEFKGGGEIDMEKAEFKEVCPSCGEEVTTKMEKVGGQYITYFQCTVCDWDNRKNRVDVMKTSEFDFWHC